MGKLTNGLIQFIENADQHQISDRAIEVANSGFCDTIGVMIAGLNEPVCDILLQYALNNGSLRQSRAALGSNLVSVADAALIGGTAAHVLDLDDYAFSNHPSAVMVPAIIAESEVTAASGADMIRAYIIGYEVWRTIMKRETGHLHSKGWHPTAIFGAFGVVAAIAVLRKLEAVTIRNALGLAVAHGGGVMANFGTMAKSYQGGRAAQAGVSAVRLAMAGLDSGPDALDNVEGGFLKALSPEGNVDLISAPSHLGVSWSVESEALNIKKYPTVGASQRGIDCAVQLHNQHNIEPNRISAIRPFISEKHFSVMQFHQPQTALEAKFSIEFAVVAGLVRGKVGFEELDNAFVQRADVQALMEKVEVVVGPDDDPEFPVGARADTVEVQFDDGSKIVSEEVTRARGHGRNPMDKSELKEKFLTCVRRRMDDDTAEQYYLSVCDINALSSAREIPDLP